MTIKKAKNIGADDMRILADIIKSHAPGLGFALIVCNVENEIKIGNYISNIHEDFAIKILEKQLEALKNKTTFQTP
ncbi:hypothetical protein [Mucilaginibacter sp.]